jgi:hypothetical protein
MSNTIRVKPAPGRRVRMPDGTLLPDEGRAVEHDMFWVRRIADEDVIVLPDTTEETSR